MEEQLTTLGAASVVLLLLIREILPWLKDIATGGSKDKPAKHDDSDERPRAYFRTADRDILQQIHVRVAEMHEMMIVQKRHQQAVNPLISAVDNQARAIEELNRQQAAHTKAILQLKESHED